MDFPGETFDSVKVVWGFPPSCTSLLKNPENILASSILCRENLVLCFSIRAILFSNCRINFCCCQIICNKSAFFCELLLMSTFLRIIRQTPDDRNLFFIKVYRFLPLICHFDQREKSFWFVISTSGRNLFLSRCIDFSR